MLTALRRRAGLLRWGLPVGLLTLLAAGLPALALARPPAEPTVTLIHTGRGGLALVEDAAGRRVVLGGSAERTAASALLDRQQWPWERALTLLLAPPRADHLPGALDLLERRPVARAGLLGLGARAHPALATWQARHPDPPLVGQATIPLAGEARLWLDTGDDPAGEAALVLVERGPVRLLLLVGDAVPLAVARLTAGRLPPPTAVAALAPTAATLPPPWTPPLTIALASTSRAGPPRLLVLGEGQAIQIVLGPDRLRVQGDPVAATRGGE